MEPLGPNAPLYKRLKLIWKKFQILILPTAHGVFKCFFLHKLGKLTAGQIVRQSLKKHFVINMSDSFFLALHLKIYNAGQKLWVKAAI